MKGPRKLTGGEHRAPASAAVRQAPRWVLFMHSLFSSSNDPVRDQLVPVCLELSRFQHTKKVLHPKKLLSSGQNCEVENIFSVFRVRKLKLRVDMYLPQVPRPGKGSGLWSLELPSA